MSLAALALMAWVAMFLFAAVPKGFTLTEMVFLYFVIVILTIAVFTVLDVNLQWAPLTRAVEGSFAMYICRFLVIPFLDLMSACALRSHLKAIWRYTWSAVIIALLCGADRVYLGFDLIECKRWNEGYSALTKSLRPMEANDSRRRSRQSTLRHDDEPLRLPCFKRFDQMILQGGIAGDLENNLALPLWSKL